MKKGVLIVIGFFLSPGLLFAEEKTLWKKGDPLPPLTIPMSWPKLEEVEVKGYAEFQNNVFAYKYDVYNSTRNLFPLYHLAVDVRVNPESHPFSTQCVTPQHSGTQHDAAIIEAPRVEISGVSSPDKWHPVVLLKPSGTTLYGAWSAGWTGEGWDLASSLLLRPGEIAGGFTMTTQIPVGIRYFRVEALLNPDFDHGLMNIPYERHSFYLDSPDFNAEINKGVEYLGKTIAPVAPPEPFTVSSWTTRMEADAIEARALGWIKTDKQLSDIMGLIAELKTEELKKLRNAVKKIERYVLSEKNKGSMTDEADALIRLNAQYLLRRSENPGNRD
ncbi:MAG: hypothetical protein RDU13_10130 [Elusimicrobiales bacterium]|nr:hypothetical protein [Elusimicrobiales bacterium]